MMTRRMDGPATRDAGKHLKKKRRKECERREEEEGKVRGEDGREEK